MRTTVDLPDELFRRLKVRAAMSGVTLKDLLAAYVEEGLSGVSGATAARRRADPPLALPASGRPIRALTQAEAEALLDAEEAGHARR